MAKLPPPAQWSYISLGNGVRENGVRNRVRIDDVGSILKFRIDFPFGEISAEFCRSVWLLGSILNFCIGSALSIGGVCWHHFRFLEITKIIRWQFYFGKRPRALARNSWKSPEDNSTGVYFGESPFPKWEPLFVGRARGALTKWRKRIW